MRNVLLIRLRNRIAESVRREIADARDVTDSDPALNGTFGFHVGEAKGTHFFLAVAANEETDEFRVNFAWGATATYPRQPFGDIRAALEEHLKQTAAEFQLALFSPDTIPWEWGLDEGYRRWHAEMATAQMRVRQDDPESQRAFMLMLQGRPKSCSIAAAKQRTAVVADEIGSAVKKFAVPLMASWR